MELIHGAIYLERATATEARILGVKLRTVVLEGEVGSFELSHAEFQEDYELTDRHDHEHFCCRGHGTHSIPHRGCILR